MAFLIVAFAQAMDWAYVAFYPRIPLFLSQFAKLLVFAIGLIWAWRTYPEWKAHHVQQVNTEKEGTMASPVNRA